MGLKQWVAKRIPDREALAANRWLSWLGPRLRHPRLWHVNRRGIALGLAIGVFFGLLIPVAQIPLAGVVAVLLRANVPTAIGSTLVTNPVTFAPIYLFAYQIGAMVLGHGLPDVVPQVIADRGAEIGGAAAHLGLAGWLSVWYDRVMAAGKPLVVGLMILASVISLASYLVVSWSWRIRTAWQWRRRRLRARARAADRPH